MAHGCHPERGSEDGAGWMWCRLLARLGSVTVLTRTDNRDAIERALPSVPERDRLAFVYYQVPVAEGRWQADRQGKRAYYLLWQRGALRMARRLQDELGFDLVWHLTWSNAWVGSVLALMNRPFVWGPLGGGIAPPIRLTATLGLRGLAYEAARSLVRAWGRYANPLARVSWQRAGLILVSNQEMQRWLPERHRSKVTVIPQYGLVDDDRRVAPAQHGSNGGASPDLRTALFVGRLLAFKGGSLALQAVAHSPEWRLVICGTGPDEARLRRLVERLGINDRVRFAGWLARDEVLSLMYDADVLLFPSLHDESPATVLEARLTGLPVICLDRGGAAVLAGEAASVVSAAGTSGDVVRRIAAALQHVDRDRNSSDAGLAQFSIDSRAAALRPLLQQLIAPDAVSDASDVAHG